MSELQQFASPPLVQHYNMLSDAVRATTQSLPQTARNLMCKTCESLSLLTYAFDVLLVIEIVAFLIDLEDSIVSVENL